MGQAPSTAWLASLLAREWELVWFHMVLVGQPEVERRELLRHSQGPTAMTSENNDIEELRYGSKRAFEKGDKTIF